MAMALPEVSNAGRYPFDAPLSVAVGLLLVVGLTMVYSATTETALRLYGVSFALLLRHGIYLGLAGFAALTVLALPVSFWERVHRPAVIVAMVLLVLVFVPGIGRTVNGATRWIQLGPIGSLQGSEFAKLLVVLYAAGYLARNRETLTAGWRHVAWLLGLLVPTALLLLLEPDYGAMVVVVSTVFGLMFLAGIPLFQLLPIGVVGVAGVAAIAWFRDYRLDRLDAFLDPWQDRFDTGYQLTQALIAFGRGEWIGLGLGNSVQKLFYLPEAHTDFLLSILAEELGGVAAILVTLLCLVVVFRCLAIGRSALVHEQTFAGLLAMGIGLLLGIQMLINLGVNVGVLPTKGLTLPLFSYGGNSLIVSLLAIAMVLRIHYEVGRSAPPSKSRRRAA